MTGGGSHDALRELECLKNQIARTAAVTWYDGNRWTALHAAAAVGNIDACRRLLAAGANAKWRTAHGADVVAVACQAQQVQIVALFTAADLPPPPSHLMVKKPEQHQQQQQRQNEVHVMPLPPPLELATTNDEKDVQEAVPPTFESFIENTPITCEGDVRSKEIESSPPTLESGVSIGRSGSPLPTFESCVGSSYSSHIPPPTFESCVNIIKTKSPLPTSESGTTPFFNEIDLADASPPPPPSPLSDEKSSSHSVFLGDHNRRGERDPSNLSPISLDAGNPPRENELGVVSTGPKSGKRHMRRQVSCLEDIEESRKENVERRAKTLAATKHVNAHLLRACTNLRLSLIQSLLGQGAVATCSRSSDGFSPLHAVLAPSLGKSAGDESLRLQCVRLLLDADKQTAAALDVHGHSPLFFAVKSGSLLLTAALLDAMPEMAMHATKTTGTSVLHVASASGFTHLINALCRAGARVDAVSVNGQTPLAAASSHGHIGAVRALLANGASVRHEQAALKVALERRHHEVAVTLLDARVPLSAKIAELARASGCAAIVRRVKRRIAENKEKALNAAEIERIRQANETRIKFSIADDK